MQKNEYQKDDIETLQGVYPWGSLWGVPGARKMSIFCL